jgi:hypothetical protein
MTDPVCEMSDEWVRSLSPRCPLLGVFTVPIPCEINNIAP